MTTSITYLPDAKPTLGKLGLGRADNPRELDFEQALREVEWAHRSLLMDRLAAQARVQEALDAAEQLEKEAQRRLDKALLQFSFAGGSAEDLGDIADHLPEQFTSVLEFVREPLAVEVIA